MWFATPDRHTWVYAAPILTKVNITNGDNITTLQLHGAGKITLKEGMSLCTNELIIRGSNTVISRGNIIVKKNYINTTAPKLEEWQMDQLPILNESERIYAFLDNKRLYNIRGRYARFETRTVPIEKFILCTIRKTMVEFRNTVRRNCWGSCNHLWI